VELSLVDVEVGPPREGELLVRVEAAPINPSDLGLLFGPADLSTLRIDGDKTVAKIPQPFMAAIAGRLGQSLAVGTEGAGTVVAAGPDAASQALIGRTVAVFGGAMFAQYRTHRTTDVLVLPEGTKATEGAASFANPLTALAMTETLHMEGHRALVHTAAASNLGQMLNRICLRDGIDLVNIVRSPAQVRLLRDMGAVHVVDSSSPTFMSALISAIAATDASLAFDAVGGGGLASEVLSAMEQAQSAKAQGYSRYGSTVHKQVYIYGGLSPTATLLARSYGMAWGVGGWILTGFLAKLGPVGVKRLRQRVVDELTTTFTSHFTAQISLSEALDPEHIAVYAQKRTGEKYLIIPTIE
jgi:NADPH:quinone reductase-like Zn-dependent oxidoreductase